MSTALLMLTFLFGVGYMWYLGAAMDADQEFPKFAMLAAGCFILATICVGIMAFFYGG